MLKWGNPWYAGQMWNYGGGCATCDNYETGLQTLPQLLVEAVTRLFSFPFTLPDGFPFYWAAAQSLMAGKFLLRYTDHMDRLQCHDFKNPWSLEETTEETLLISNANTDHNNQESDRVCQWTFCTVYPEPSSHWFSTVQRTFSLQPETQIVNQTSAVSTQHLVHSPLACI